MKLSQKEQILEYLKTVKDPEVPVLNVVELGVVRNVDIDEDGVRIDITPTYSGCPAMNVMEREIVAELKSRGIEKVSVKTIFSPPWTTEWMSEESRQKLKEYGISPPGKVEADDHNPFNFKDKKTPCPFCDSQNTELTSQFGSTACKALYYCHNCEQPFEHFKCI